MEAMIVSFCDWRRIFLSLLGVGLIVGGAFGQVPKTIAFQGLLTDEQGVTLASGDYGITFRLYNVSVDGSALWTEVQTVNVLDGVGNATLGRINPLTLSFDAPYWLGLTLQQGGTELTPRIPLSSGPYAFMAQSVPDGSITAAKIADGAVTTDKIQEGGFDGAAIADGAITPGKLADGVVTAVKMGSDAVGTGAIIDGSITSDDLAAEAIGTEAIAAGAVTPVKLNTTGASNGQSLVFNGATMVWGAPSGSGVLSEVATGAGLTGGGTEGTVTLSIDTDAVTADLLGEDAVGNSELAVNAVDTENILDGSVTKEKLDKGGATSGDVLSFDGADVVWAATSLADGSVTKEKLDPGAAVSGDVLSFDGSDVLWAAPVLPDGSVTEAKLAQSAVTEDKIGDGAVSSDKLATSAVSADKLAIDAATTDKIADSAVTAGKIAHGAVTNGKVADAAITVAKIDASTAAADDVIRYTGSATEWGPVSIPNGSVETDKLADLAVSTAKIANAAVNADKIAALSVGTSQIADGAITNAKIGGFVNLDKLTTLGADEGDVVTFTTGVVTWAPGNPLSHDGDVSITGNLAVTGTLTKGGGTFMIDHPLDPENRYLYHSFVESDEMMNVYSGNATLSGDGTAWVDLPDWFESLNKDFRYQLTCIGGYAPVFVASPIEEGRFKIAGGEEGLQVSWQVTAVRNDPWAQKNRMRVEVDKQPADKGTLLHPEAYEQ